MQLQLFALVIQVVYYSFSGHISYKALTVSAGMRHFETLLQNRAKCVDRCKERVLVKFSTKRGKDYEAKRRSCKLDCGFVVLSTRHEDLDTLDYFAEFGMTATMPRDYTQQINFEADNRCKPERGVFLSKSVQDLEKLCWKKQTIYGQLNSTELSNQNMFEHEANL